MEICIKLVELSVSQGFENVWNQKYPLTCLTSPSDVQPISRILTRASREAIEYPLDYDLRGNYSPVSISCHLFMHLRLAT